MSSRKMDDKIRPNRCQLTPLETDPGSYTVLHVSKLRVLQTRVSLAVHCACG
jgi:hypothetical protein